jgi:uncharacterized protein (TIGR03435 family)
MRYIAGALAVLIAPIVLAQNAASPAFEVVSIKPHNPAIDYTSSGLDGLEWTATNFSLLLLVRAAYPGYTDEGRIIAGEPWMRETRFEVRAKGVGPLAYPAVHGMIQRMLADRFRLRTHFESRSFDVYVARLTSADGSPGRWLVPTAPECLEVREKGGPPPSSCERLVKAREAEGGRRAFTLLALSLPNIFQVFRQVGGFDRPIVDRTGLSGPYDVSVRYDSANSVDVPAGGVSLMTAARDQLGLRFDRARESLDVLVIDSATLPEPD